MRRVGLAWILPLVQLLLAIGLLHWGSRTFPPKRFDTLWMPTATMICQGINAPALPLSIFGRLFGVVDQAPPSFLGFGPGELFFLAGVIIIWCLIGRVLDGHSFRDTSGGLGHTLLNVFLMAWGILLFCMALAPLRNPGFLNNRFGNVVEGILFVCWSLLLVITSVLRFARTLRRRQVEAT
jgi:hypothetical protein